jgi:hypothetical protein
MSVLNKIKREKYQHHYYDDQTIENLAHYFRVDQHQDMLNLLKKLRKDGY